HRVTHGRRVFPRHANAEVRAMPPAMTMKTRLSFKGISSQLHQPCEQSPAWWIHDLVAERRRREQQCVLKPLLCDRRLVRTMLDDRSSIPLDHHERKCLEPGRLVSVVQLGPSALDRRVDA